MRLRKKVLVLNSRAKKKRLVGNIVQILCEADWTRQLLLQAWWLFSVSLSYHTAEIKVGNVFFFVACSNINNLVAIIARLHYAKLNCVAPPIQISSHCITIYGILEHYFSLRYLPLIMQSISGMARQCLILNGKTWRDSKR